MSKSANYNEYDIRQNDLPKRLQKDFGLSERFTVSLVETIRMPDDAPESFSTERGVEATKHKGGYVEGLLDDEGDKIHMEERHVRITKIQEFDIAVTRTEATKKHDADLFTVRGWKKS